MRRPQRLNRLVGQKRLHDPDRRRCAIRVAKEWQPLEEIVGAALNRVEEAAGDRRIEVHLPADLPLVPIDAVLIEQVLINLPSRTRLAQVHPPAAEPRSSSPRAGRTEAERVVVAVADRGPGVPPELVDKIFEKFYRLPREHAGSGAGLGLAICRGIVQAHGGRVAVRRTVTGGCLPLHDPVEGTPPRMRETKCTEELSRIGFWTLFFRRDGVAPA